MSEFSKNKAASIFATVLIGIIVLSFMFTGYESLRSGGSSAGAIGKVGDLPIKPEEYEQEFKRQLEFYKQMMGGELNSKQIEAMNIKESTLKNIIQRKLMVKLASDIGTFPSEEEVKTESKSSSDDDKNDDTQSMDPEFLKTRIESIDLSPRTINALSGANIRTIGGLVRKKEEDILDIDGLGTKGVQEIRKMLSQYGISLK